MKLGDLYRSAIAAGIENDPRSKDAVLQNWRDPKKTLKA